MSRKLDRLNGSNDKGVAFQRLWQRNCETVESNFTDISQVVSDLAAAVADIATAQAAAAAAAADAAAAQTTANTANTTATTVKRDDSISTSWTSPGSILSATDAGANATITVANHTRKYSDTTSVSVTGANITALAYSTLYDVYYDQTSRAGGAVTYHATTNPNTGMANAVAGRHWCGSITTPAAAAPPTSGGVYPPSSGGRYTDTNIP